MTIPRSRSAGPKCPTLANAYLTVMAGATYNTVVEAAVDGSAGLHRAVWTGTFGIGGTLDMASLLAKN